MVRPMLRLLARLTGLGLVLLCVPVLASADGVRRLLSAEEQAGWSAVGRLNVAGQGFCTGTLIAPQVVLTAAHCLVDRRSGRTVDPSRVHFLAGYRIGAYAAHGRAARIVLAPGHGDGGLQNDIALVALRSPMGAEIRPIALSSELRLADRLGTLSYGLDRSQALSLEDGCQVSRRQGSVVLTSCEAVPGLSGAPLLRWLPEGPRLVAVGAALVQERRRPIPRGRLLAVGISTGVMTQMHALLAGD